MSFFYWFPVLCVMCNDSPTYILGSFIYGSHSLGSTLPNWQYKRVPSRTEKKTKTGKKHNSKKVTSWKIRWLGDSILRDEITKEKGKVISILRKLLNRDRGGGAQVNQGWYELGKTRDSNGTRKLVLSKQGLRTPFSCTILWSNVVSFSKLTSRRFTPVLSFIV